LKATLGRQHDRGQQNKTMQIPNVARHEPYLISHVRPVSPTISKSLDLCHRSCIQ
jgi:hypothetical protein